MQWKRQYLYLTDGTQICIRMSMTGLEELFLPYEEITWIKAQGRGRGVLMRGE